MSDQELPVDAHLVEPAAVGTEMPSAPRVAPTSWTRQCGRFLYNHNPFYLASAWMVFCGLRASFPVSSGSIDAWTLTLCLMGYTLLLSVTAFLVIRLGKVWDDARSLLLLIVLMFLGISVTFDGILANVPEQAPPYYVLGWLFAATITEVLLRSLPLRLGLLFRVPLHLLLALFYLYPLVLKPRLLTPGDPVLAWQLFGFPSAAALIFLDLLPAVRRGPAYIADNGSPWRWPLYPWVLFGMLGFCISLRAYYLCVSLHFVGASNTIFAPYFLVPLGLAAVVLLLETGLVCGSRNIVQWAMFLPVLVIAMASIGRDFDPVHRGFLRLFEQTLGATPFLVTLWLVAAVYLIAAVRGVLAANYLLLVTLVSIALVPARTQWAGLEPLPLAMASAWQIALGWRRGRSGDVVVGSCLALASATMTKYAAWIALGHGIVPIHLLLLMLLGAGYWYQDRTGHFARRAAVTLGVILSAIAALSDAAYVNELPGWIRMLYPLAMAMLIAAYSHATGDVCLYAGAAAAALVGCADVSSRAYSHLLHRIAGLHELACGALFFLLAAAISVFKSGLRPAWMRRPDPLAVVRGRLGARGARMSLM